MAFLGDCSFVNSSILCDSEDLKLDIHSALYNILQIISFSDEQVKNIIQNFCLWTKMMYSVKPNYTPEKNDFFWGYRSERADQVEVFLFHRKTMTDTHLVVLVFTTLSP